MDSADGSHNIFIRTVAWFFMSVLSLLSHRLSAAAHLSLSFVTKPEPLTPASSLPSYPRPCRGHLRDKYRGTPFAKSACCVCPLTRTFVCSGDLLFFLRVHALLRGLATRLKVRQKYMDIMAPYAKRVRFPLLSLD